MTINKMPLFKIAAVILYLLFFLLMQELFSNLKNTPNTMMALDENFYRLLWLKLALTQFFQWFLLGVVLAFLNLNNHPRFHFTKGLFLIAMAWMVVVLMGAFPGYLHYGWFRPEYQVLLYDVVPIFSGFFLFKSLFGEEKITCPDRNLIDGAWH